MLAAGALHAQTSSLPPVHITVTPAPPTVTGFGDIPLKETPVSASVIGRRDMDNAGARRLADLTRFDASVADAYNAPGYWDFLSIRGFTLDNRFNYRREGLPISAETPIPLDNKERVEILKGTSGIQAGTSAPGGLVNYVVKRPTDAALREVKLEATQRASLLAAVDLGGRFGVNGAFGYRLNVAHERLRPRVRDLDGERSLFALATDWRLSRDALLESEFEYSRQTQPSQVGFSLLGPVLPAPADPRLNLNNQPWSQASDFGALAGTLRYTRSIGKDWRWSAQLGTQRLKSDDYTAFPFGCSAEGNFDRYCSDGSFDYYDFRSENERRRQDAAALNLQGRFDTGAVRHDLSAGVLATRLRHRFQPQAFNWVGIGSVDGTSAVPSDPTAAFVVPDRDEKSVELSLADAIQWNERLTTWLGLRHTRLDRGYRQGITTPWAAVSYRMGSTLAYASWGEGAESHQVTMNPATSFLFTNPGQVLPAARSRQWELGVKGGDNGLGWQAALFRIERPLTNFDFCTRTFSTCAGDYDGVAVHRGVEGSAQWSHGPWQLSGGVTLLDAQRQGSSYEPANNGKRPPNVPEHIVRATAQYRVPSVPGLELEGHMSHEGRRATLADESVWLPSWTRFDAAVRYSHRIGATQASWTVGMQNLFDRRFWKESPYQFGHVYLYPGAPRTLRVSFNAAF